MADDALDSVLEFDKNNSDLRCRKQAVTLLEGESRGHGLMFSRWMPIVSKRALFLWVVSSGIKTILSLLL